MKKKIKIKFINGLNFEIGMNDILNFLTPYYDFIDSNKPDFIVFGVYGNDIPPKGNYTRIGYFCENIKPDLSICEWAFGIPYTEEINHPNYMRIDWHGFDPRDLVKKNIDIDKIISQKTKFCNFTYSHPVAFREKFFEQLSKYKSIDAPGKSMKNMPSIDSQGLSGNKWEIKRSFLSQYKFTIAFENDSYPGYHTEKILDPMLVNSIPIYWGNPNIDQHFNPKSFINTHDYLSKDYNHFVKLLESTCQADFKDIRPQFYNSLGDSVKRKIKIIGRNLKLKLQYANFDDLIEQIIAIDKNEDLYRQYLLEPWFHNNTVSQNPMIQRWQKIFG